MTLIATRLSHSGLLELHGPDAVKFLQGQTTNDVAGCPTNRWQHGAHCTPKGRMIANFDLVCAADQRLLLRLPADVLPILQAALGKYIVFSKASLTDVSDRYQRIGLLGEDPTALLQSLGLEVPFGPDSTVQVTDSGVFLRLDERRVECWLTTDQPLPEALTSLLDDDQESASRQWRQRDIALGRGWITAATSDGFLPQDLNLQTAAIAGVHFKKGCYTGQEIVARMHYKGKLKRHLYLLAAEPPAAEVPAGTSVLDAAGNTVGTVINAEITGDQLQLLAVMTAQAYSANDGLQLPSATRLTGLPQPYPIEPV